MASRFSPRPYRLPRFRQLIPPPASVSQRLAFHTTARNQILDTCLGYTHSTLHSLHHFTGLSWAITIPLTALIVRALANPLIVHSDKMRRHRLLLQPTTLAWIHVIRQKAVREHGELGPKAVDRMTNRAIRLKRKEIHTRHGIRLWKSLLPLVQAPVFLLISELLRRMSGMGLGALGLLAGGFNLEPKAEERIEHPAVPLEHSVDANLADHSMDLLAGRSNSESAAMEAIKHPAVPWEQSVNENLADNSMDLLAGRSNAESAAVEAIEHPAVPLEQSVNEKLADNSMDLFEPSFASEGALWFPDLLLPDPTLLLPFILSFSLLANIYYHTRWYPTQSKWQKRYINIMWVMALATGPLTLRFPSAILIYWISNSLIGLGHLRILQWYKPPISPFEPCKPRQKRVLLGDHQAGQHKL